MCNPSLLHCINHLLVNSWTQFSSCMIRIQLPLHHLFHWRDINFFILECLYLLWFFSMKNNHFRFFRGICKKNTQQNEKLNSSKSFSPIWNDMQYSEYAWNSIKYGDYFFHDSIPFLHLTWLKHYFLTGIHELDESEKVWKKVWKTIRMMVAHSVLWQEIGQCDLLFFLVVYMYSVLCNICFFIQVSPILWYYLI